MPSKSRMPIMAEPVAAATKLLASFSHPDAIQRDLALLFERIAGKTQ